MNLNINMAIARRRGLGRARFRWEASHRKAAFGFRR